MQTDGNVVDRSELETIARPTFELTEREGIGRKPSPRPVTETGPPSASETRTTQPPRPVPSSAAARVKSGDEVRAGVRRLGLAPGGYHVHSIDRFFLAVADDIDAGRPLVPLVDPRLLQPHLVGYRRSAVRRLLVELRQNYSASAVGLAVAGRPTPRAQHPDPVGGHVVPDGTAGIRGAVHADRATPRGPAPTQGDPRP